MRNKINAVILLSLLVALFHLSRAFAGPEGRLDSLKRIARVCYNANRYEESIKYLLEAMKVGPDDPAIYVGLGDAYKEMGQNKDAIKQYETAMKLAPSSAINYVKLGDIYLKMNNYDAAIELLRKATEIDSGNAKYYYKLATAYLNNHDYANAIKFNRMGIKVNPADYECYFGLGEVYRAMEKYNEAIKWYKESERLSSSVNYSCPYQGLGNVYKRIGKPSQAESSYLSAIKESANFYRGYYLIADYYYQVGELTKADININKALGLCKEEQKRKVLVLKGMILISQQKYSEAEKLFTGMRKEYGDGYDILTGLGHICNARKEYGKAMEYFQKAVGSKEKGWRIGTYLGMAWVRANEGRHKEAIELYKEVLKSEPLNILALLGMGNAYNWLGDYSEAERYFQKVLDIDKDNEYALAELGTVYLNKGDSRRSEQLFSQSIRINNTNYTCPYEGLGLLYLKQGDTKKAEESFLKAIRINPDIEFRKFNGLAKIYIKQGKLKEAKELLEKSIANYPYDNEARQLLKELESGNRKL